MTKLNISTLLNLLPVVGPVVAALPEFKKLWDEASAAFGHADQATLKTAYADALAGAATQHAATQATVDANK